MLFRRLLTFALAPLLCWAQADPSVQQKLLDEMKNVRASLVRIEKGQNALLALIRIQVEEGRVAALEARRLRLEGQEQSVGKEIETTAAALANDQSGNSPTGPESSPALASLSQQVRNNHARASQKRDALASERRTIEESITAVRNRIAALEKYLEDSLR